MLEAFGVSAATGAAGVNAEGVSATIGVAATPANRSTGVAMPAGVAATDANRSTEAVPLASVAVTGRLAAGSGMVSPADSAGYAWMVRPGAWMVGTSFSGSCSKSRIQQRQRNNKRRVSYHR